ncbi:hypothetical protein PV726_08015 [Streptomyces europaeiscabiei]|uniref:hypothetical protein n=1 Tax=Streptomyces europaeiscabiei TaxID=146819 RepID=UPI0029BC6014|nr:hypothetical protein [Streptomyces europaeiscabiei]MDX3690269.1 hypothetical protein [Streptomyces europaeiscabiei]
MVAGVAWALCAAVCMGTATVLQALGAWRATVAKGAGGERGPGRSVVEVLRGWPFLAGAGLDTLGFAAQVVALRLVPLFLVEAAVAASLAVTAVGGTVVLGLRLRRAEWSAVAVVMKAGSATQITEFDKWMFRDFWRHMKSRYGL